MWSATLNLSLFAKNCDRKIVLDKLKIMKYPYGMMFVKRYLFFTSNMLSSLEAICVNLVCVVV